MIYFDTTSASSWKHASGLARVSRRLRDELGGAAAEVRWPGIAVRPAQADWIFTPELFSEAERPGFSEFLQRRPCRIAALYHDAIPIKHPDVTWPKSVGRHPSYMKLLSRFDRVWAISAASRDELIGFWRWQEVSRPPQVAVLPPGADWPGRVRVLAAAPGASPPRIVCVGILEPRKNQGVILDACEVLWREGTNFELHLVGRVNPHFGGPLAERVRELGAQWPGLRHHARMDDAGLAALVGSARATAFASYAEGCGLPVLESLWMGVPCVCSDIAPVAENAAAGGCLTVPGNGLAGWTDALRRILKDDTLHSLLGAQATSRALPTWAEAAAVLRVALA